MIILNTNSELKETFDRLIQAMQVQVEWNGQFVIIGDYLILHGRVRSLFFNFENRKVVTNLIDIPMKEEEIIDVGEHRKVQNVLNLALYAFGKWGSIKGVRVEQDYAQLNTIFTNVLREFSIEPGYSNENFRFYKSGIRFSYEDVIQSAIESKEDDADELQTEQETESGLWHKLVWKKKKAGFPKQEISFQQRQKKRLGNNFYMVSYMCPKCKEHLHMIVFPETKEFRVETDEGGVFLARAYSCESCCCFYTPRPGRLLAEGDVYEMDFEGDRRAYDDYLELLGRYGDHVANYKFNEYEMVRKRKAELLVEEESESLDELSEQIKQLDDLKLEEIQAKMEEGFYPLRSIEKFEPLVYSEMKKRKAKTQNTSPHFLEAKKLEEFPKEDAFFGNRKNDVQQIVSSKKSMERQGKEKEMAVHTLKEAGNKALAADVANASEISVQRREAAKKRYAAKCGVLDRLSFEQLKELQKELKKDKNLYESEKEPFLQEIAKKEEQRKREHIVKLSDSCKNENYVKIQRVMDEIKKINLPEAELEEYLKPLYERRKKQGEKEVFDLFQKLPVKMDLKQYHAHLEHLKRYPDVDISPYQDVLEERKAHAEDLEISRMIRHSSTADRDDLLGLSERLQNQNFNPKTLAPYLEKLEDKIRALDENAIEEICGNPMQKTEAELLEAYQKIEEGVFLPELKTNALEMLKKRLTKLKIDECELLVHKFQENLDGRIRKNERHHFYPARRILAKEAKPEEYQVISYALDTYGTKRGIFEYPIFVADTSRDKSGKEGMILTPEHIFYRNMLNAYVVSIGDIRRIHAQTGFFNAGIFLELLDGTKIKIPYAADKKELLAWGNCLEEFIHYLQEKPDSRNLTYLAKEKHEQICCFRCGYSYKGGNVCPKCGYKRNQ